MRQKYVEQYNKYIESRAQYSNECMNLIKISQEYDSIGNKYTILPKTYYLIENKYTYDTILPKTYYLIENKYTYTL